MNIVIPRTIEAAVETLNGIGGLLTAKEWERAAIVYAFTKPQQGKRTSLASEGGRLSTEEFARLGITGLRGANTVWAYRKVWTEAMEDGAVEAKPGKTVTLPTRDWPGTKTGATEGNTGNVIAAIKRNPKVLAEAVRAVGTDEHIEAVTDALAEAQTDPYIRDKVDEKVAVKTANAPRYTKKPGTDWAKVIRAVLSNHGRADGTLRDLARDLPGNPVYRIDIEDILKHLEDDRVRWIPMVEAKFRAMLDDTEEPEPRPAKNVTPVKELA